MGKVILINCITNKESGSTYLHYICYTGVYAIPKLRNLLFSRSRCFGGRDEFFDGLKTIFVMNEFSGQVELFPGNMGWHYVDVPDKLIPKERRNLKWGLIPAQFAVGQTKWKSSLLPKGEGKYFVPLKAGVRKKEDIKLGDIVKIKFWFA